MIISNTAVAPTMSNVGETAKATIKASPRLFKFFSDMVYADKFIAIWRELVANGVDSQVAAGNADKSVIVTLPTTFTPYAKVRDFGTGMSHDFLMSKFMAYTDASTKENSNDFIGGFGIGSKAPLSYTEQFAINSYQKGTLRVYSVFKDADDCPAIAFLSESTTTEPDGIEISFPVEQTDIPKFKEAALKCLTYFNPLPTLRNSTEQLVAPEYSVRAESWGFRRGATTSQIVQGGVAYPIDIESVPRNLHDILGFGIDFYVPIGSVGIALSRERLSYDDATLRVLASLCETIRPKIQEHVNKMFEDIPNKWDAMVEYHKTVYGNTAAGRMVESLAHYKGEKLNRYMDPVMSDKVLTCFVTDSRWTKHGRNSWSAARANPKFSAWIGQLCPRDIDHILIVDTNDKPILRARNFLENICQRNDGVMLVKKRPDHTTTVDGKEEKWVNDLKWDDWLKAMGNPKVTYISTIEPATVTRNGTSLKRPEKIRGYKNPYKNAEFVDTLPAGGGYYVEMNLWHITGVTREEISALDTGGKPILYFNKGDIDTVKKNPEWQSVKTKVEEQKKTYKQTHKNAKLAVAFAAKTNGFSLGNSVDARLLNLVAMKGFECPKRGPMAKLGTLYRTAQPDLTDRDRVMRNLCGIDVTQCDKQLKMLTELLNQCKTQYPELATLLRVGVYNNEQLIPVYTKLMS